MRVLDTHRLELVDVLGDDIPKYAILSHTWGDEEVTFQEMQYVTQKWTRAVSQTASAIKAKSGYIKIKRSAVLAVEHGYDFIWIDTCCIDKSSSAELSEAINSMYQWYENAAVCYAYLEDVKHIYHSFTGSMFRSICQDSRWFTRGWTLQELIAPGEVLFYSADWGLLGSKGSDAGVRASLASITGIDVRVLEGLLSPADMSIATRMKWASQRKTTRAEDEAYSLMGLFDVNMPLLYGEGTKAFVRLQEEILKGSDDQTIFAWSIAAPPSESSEQLTGLLAGSPAAFAKVSNYRPLPPAISRGSTAWAITNQGLQIQLYLQPVQQDGVDVFKDEYYAILECAQRRGDGWSESPAIRMRRLYGDQFARVDPQTVRVVTTPPFVHDTELGSYEVLFVKQKPVYAAPEFVVSFDNIPQPTARQRPVSLTAVWPDRHWDAETATLRRMPSDTNRVLGLFRFHHSMLDVSIDCAVGLTRSPGGVWDYWTLQRSAGRSSPFMAALSAISFVESESDSKEEILGPLAWKKNIEGLDCINVEIRHIHLHGRLYLSVLAIPMAEVPEYDLRPKSPVELFTPGLALRADETKKPLPSRLQTLLVDVTAPTSLENAFLTSETPLFARIRTVPLASISSELRSFVSDRDIQGPSLDATKVLQACIEGEIDDLENLSAGDPLLESVTTDCFGLRPLHWAIIEGHLPIVKLLVKLGADITCRTAQGWLPFHLAALFGRFVILNWLLHEVFIDSRPESLPWTEEDLLANQENELKENVIHLAVVHISMAYAEDHKALHHLLRRPLTKKAWSLPNTYGETSYHRLAAVGSIHIESDLSIMELFANAFMGDAGLDAPESRLVDNKARTILWHAICAGSCEIIELLANLDRHRVSKADKYGITPLHLACRKGDAKVTKMLLAAGANPNARTNAPGLTPSHYAAIFNQPMCLQVLLEHGAELTWPTNVRGESFRPIHLALAGKYQQCVYVLKSVKTDMDWMCTHYIRRIHSGVDLCPFELIERSLTVTDLLGDSDTLEEYQRRTSLSIDVNCMEDENGNLIANKDEEPSDDEEVGYIHGATVNPREYGEMENELVNGLIGLEDDI